MQYRIMLAAIATCFYHFFPIDDALGKFIAHVVGNASLMVCLCWSNTPCILKTVNQLECLFNILCL